MCHRNLHCLHTPDFVGLNPCPTASHQNCCLCLPELLARGAICSEHIAMLLKPPHHFSPAMERASIARCPFCGMHQSLSTIQTCGTATPLQSPGRCYCRWAIFTALRHQQSQGHWDALSGSRQLLHRLRGQRRKALSGLPGSRRSCVAVGLVL